MLNLLTISSILLTIVSAQIPAGIATTTLTQTPSTSFPFGTNALLVDVISAPGCAANSIVAIVAAIQVPMVVAVCACVEVFNQPSFSTPCAACPANSFAICSGTTPTCGCQCNSGFIQNADGSCVLPPSAAARRTKKSQLAIPTFTCDKGESVCKTSSGFECIDTTNSLDSCGGCPQEHGGNGVNCLSLPGALAVECIHSNCHVSSCFPGFKFISGKCTRV